MVEYQTPYLDRVFHALADPTRRAMLQALRHGERPVGELAAPFQMSFAAASKHVKVLEGAGLVRRRVQGRQHLCRIEAGPLAQAHAWLRDYERFWTGRLDALQALLQAEADAEARLSTTSTQGPQP
ncbi:ArsR/SmtB family transcription factor [Bordetella petrii]|uniref:ArsR/SmtB family transcription factor n=1 Tax=Bordetella petrii TaxID=94624 RepID=UPI001E533E62|nr:metalloregulator ArsR/SmtB family transcription factor [Bordetella petrii]MCD0506016.1 metalloregulator ArsR/SmtB family transcription factor [Bordetella petrii]